MKNQGIPHDHFDGRPVIGICNTWSELTPCNAHFRELAEYVKKGVYEAGGFPLEFPVMSLGESNLRPTAMLFRNLASMDVEESIRGNPIDGVILLMGCDKTTPALLMGAASCNLPTLAVSGGPMLNGKYRGQDIGSGTGVWQDVEMVRAGTMTQEDFHRGRELHEPLARALHDDGHGVDDGVDGRGARHGLPHNAAIPAVDARRNRAGAHGRPAHRRDGQEDLTMDRRSSRARPSRTRSAPTPRSAARPTR
jgi:L-arabonate dehydrase